MKTSTTDFVKFMSMARNYSTLALSKHDQRLLFYQYCCMLISTWQLNCAALDWFRIYLLYCGNIIFRRRTCKLSRTILTPSKYSNGSCDNNMIISTWNSKDINIFCRWVQKRGAVDAFTPLIYPTSYTVYLWDIGLVQNSFSGTFFPFILILRVSWFAWHVFSWFIKKTASSFQ